MKLIQKEEIKTYDDIQNHYDILHTRSGISGENERYKKLNKWVLKILKVQPGKKILDVACGNGHLLLLAEAQGLKTYGIDISKVAVVNARKRIKTANIVVGKGEQLPYPSNFFDYVTCMGSLEHFLSPGKGCFEISRVLKKDSISCIYVPNIYCIRFVINAWLHGKSPSQKQNVERYGTRCEWEELFRNNRLKVIKLSKFNLMPINLSFCFIFLCSKME